MKFYTSLSKGLKLKVRKCLGLIPTFVKVTGEKLIGRSFRPLHPILNRVKGDPNNNLSKYTYYIRYVLRYCTKRPIKKRKKDLRSSVILNFFCCCLSFFFFFQRFTLCYKYHPSSFHLFILIRSWSTSSTSEQKYFLNEHLLRITPYSPSLLKYLHKKRKFSIKTFREFIFYYGR